MYNGILLSMQSPAQLLALARGNFHLFPETTDVQAMFHTPGGTVVTTTEDTLVPDQHSPYLTAEASGPSGHYPGNLHKVTIPAGTTHLVPNSLSPASPSPGMI